MLILLYMFSSVVTLLRGLQEASELERVQKKLGCTRASLGSLSESVAVFDAERLKPIIESLGEKLVPIAADKRLKDIQQTLTLVDGSIVVFDVLEENPWAEADRAARVLSDQIISLGSGNARGKPNHPVRLVVIEAKPHKSKGRPGKGLENSLRTVSPE